jgi:hypothetical protein
MLFHFRLSISHSQIPKFLRPYMDKDKEEITHKSISRLERGEVPELEDEKPLVVADAELLASYEKQQKEQKEHEKLQQEERRKNDQLRMRSKIIDKSKVLLTEDTAHVFQTKREKSRTNQFSTKRGPDRANDSTVAKKRQKLMALVDEEDDDIPTTYRKEEKTTEKKTEKRVESKPKSFEKKAIGKANTVRLSFAEEEDSE